MIVVALFLSIWGAVFSHAVGDMPFALTLSLVFVVFLIVTLVKDQAKRKSAQALERTFSAPGPHLVQLAPSRKIAKKAYDRGDFPGVEDATSHMKKPVAKVCLLANRIS